MNDFFASQMCQSKKYCLQCRSDERFRKGITGTFDVDDHNFECPHGITLDNLTDKIKSGEIKYSSLGSRIKEVSKNLILSAIDSVAGKSGLSSQEDVDIRIATCTLCEHGNVPGDSCDKCGCTLSRKTRVKHSECPIGKW